MQVSRLGAASVGGLDIERALTLLLAAIAPIPADADASRQNTPATAIGVADHVWSIGELIDAALTAVRTKPTPTPAQRRRQFRAIQGDVFD